MFTAAICSVLFLAIFPDRTPSSGFHPYVLQSLFVLISCLPFLEGCVNVPWRQHCEQLEGYVRHPKVSDPNTLPHPFV